MNISRLPTGGRKSANDRTYQPKISVSPIQPTTTSAEPPSGTDGASRAPSARSAGRRPRRVQWQPASEGDRADRRGQDEDREPEREREADPPWPLLRRLVDLVEGADRRADDPGHLPDGQRCGEREQSCGRRREHLVHGLVPSVEDSGKNLRLDLRPDRVLPEATLVGRAEDAEPEQRARDRSDEHPQCDRACVREDAVAVEEIDPEPHELLEAAPAWVHGTAAFPRRQLGNDRVSGRSWGCPAGRAASRR